MTDRKLSTLYAQAEQYLARGEPLIVLNLLETIQTSYSASNTFLTNVSPHPRPNIEYQYLSSEESLDLQALRFQAYDMIYCTSTDRAARETAYALAHEAIVYVMTHHQGRYQNLVARYQESYEPKAKNIKIGKARARQQRRMQRRARYRSSPARQLTLALTLVSVTIVLLMMLLNRWGIPIPLPTPISAVGTMKQPTFTLSPEARATELSIAVAPTAITRIEPLPTLTPSSVLSVQTSGGIADQVLVQPNDTFNPVNMRFYRLPIHVYARSLDDEWDIALSSALLQVQQAISITRVPSPAQADIIVEVVSETTYTMQDCPLPEEVLGCGWIIAVRQNSSSTQVDAYDYRGFVRIIETAPNPPGIMLHELLHALGLRHSDIRGDIMFPFFGSDSSMSEHDLALLRALYHQ
ncbi:matrixin family metalloprotease [Phototrophicus methaneseepsis]|uniref:Matrixin family metalloprotease n=1 Tax=Phototrophicus methaneseepsis TaxID=2710758 RepID=A0A7S8IFJ2_9CHLR|nr:matrixin family metalloprotease [Phototrophicus methaneseepsis]QPC83652.1 matrixin family metalloprotease [Phototrophicus methaneseepsis]